MLILAGTRTAMFDMAPPSLQSPSWNACALTLGGVAFAILSPMSSEPSCP